MIAVQSFKQACIGGAYQQHKIPTKYLENESFLIMLYNHYVHFYKKGHYNKEKRNPGSVNDAAFKANLYRRRGQVSKHLDNLVCILIFLT
jgi:hypothetical protein